MYVQTLQTLCVRIVHTQSLTHSRGSKQSCSRALVLAKTCIEVKTKKPLRVPLSFYMTHLL